MKELKVVSKKYNDKDVLEIENLGEALEGEDINVKDINASGKISGKEIIENMSGYSMNDRTTEGLTKTPVYGGIVKNGNKLTIVYACNIIRTANTSGGVSYLAEVKIPASIGKKLNVVIGTYTLARERTLFASKSNESNDKFFSCTIQKNSNTLLYIATPTSYLNTLVVNEEYYVRIEATFLLSENLIK